jgi:hypothetical protein
MEEILEKDQVQTDSPETEAPKGAKVIKKDQAPKEQSEKSEPVVEAPKTYKTPDGRDLSPDEIYAEYNKLHPEFTRRSQKLAEYEKREQEATARNERAAEQAVSQNKLLEDVDPNVKAAIIEIVKGPINEALQAREKEAAAKLSQEKFDQRLNELEKKYPGKFNKLEILREMQRPENEIYDPEVLYQKLHWDSYLDDQIKAALKGKSGSNQTESTSTEAPRKPGETKPPTTWAEASKNAISRL